MRPRRALAWYNRTEEREVVERMALVSPFATSPTNPTTINREKRPGPSFLFLPEARSRRRCPPRSCSRSVHTGSPHQRANGRGGRQYGLWWVAFSLQVKPLFWTSTHPVIVWPHSSSSCFKSHRRVVLVLLFSSCLFFLGSLRSSRFLWRLVQRTACT